MEEEWKPIRDFPGYSVSNFGMVQNDYTGRWLRISLNQYGVPQVGMMQSGIQRHRSLPLLVARTFIKRTYPAFDTPINLDGNRFNNRVDNLMWRPRWFAVKYNYQFRHPSERYINHPIRDLKTGEISEGSFDCAKRYGLLEDDLIESILQRTYVWPTYQTFEVVEN